MTIFPKKGAPGKDYTLTIRSKNCKLKESTLAVPADIDKTEPEVISTDGCTMKAKITISPEAVLDNVMFDVTDKDGVIYPFEFTIKEKAAGPIPPGLEPQADIMWSVLPRTVVRDNFGRKVANQYYCIEINIGNNTGYDLQISSVGFTIPALAKKAKALKYENTYVIPANNYKTTRGTIEWEQRVGIRNLVVNLIKGFGPVLTGFVPYFHDMNHRSNFSEGVNIFSNPIDKGFELVIPDRTVRSLDRLEDQVLHEGVIIPNNTQEKTYKVFLPKEFLKSIMDEEYGEGRPSSDRDRNDPHKVMLQLGELVLMGVRVQHLNRVQVISRGVTAAPRDTSEVELFGDQFITQGEEKELLFNGSFDDDADVTLDSGLEKKKVTVSEGGKVLKVLVKASDDMRIGMQDIDIKSKGETTRKSIKVEPAVPADTALAYDDAEPTENPDNPQDVRVTITGKHLSGVNSITPIGNAVGKIKATIQSSPAPSATEIHALVHANSKTPAGDYELELRNNNREGKTSKVTFKINPQPAPENLTVAYKEAGARREDPPKANPQNDQTIVFIVRGDNLDKDTKIIDPLPQTTQGKLEIKSQAMRNGNLRTVIILKKEAEAGAYPLVIKNKGGGTQEVQFEVAPNP